MKIIYIVLPLLCICTAMAAQDHIRHNHADDSTDVFFRHLQLNELTVTGVTGDTKLKHATTPVSIVTPQMLRATASPSARCQSTDHGQQHLETDYPRTGL